MYRTLNLRLLVWATAAFIPAAVAVHFVHGYQVRRHAHSLRGRGEQALAQDRPEQALAHFAQYLGFVPDDRDAREQYARLFDRVAGPADRVRVVLLLQQLLLDRPNLHDVRFRLVHNLIAVGRISDAAHEIRALEGRWSDPAELKHMLGWCQEAREQYRDAAASFQAAIRLDPKRLDSYALLAQVLADRLDDAAEARRVIDAMVSANPEAYRAYLLRSHYLLRHGREEAADADLRRAVELAPERADVALAAAERLQARGKPDEAYALLADAVRREPGEAALYKAMAEVKLRAGDRAAALTMLTRGLARLPRAADLLALQTDLLIDTEDLAGAGERLRELRALAPDSALPDYLQARIAIARSQWAEATALLERCRKELKPGAGWSSRVHALLGVCYRQAGDAVQELAAFRRAVLDEPTWSAARTGLGTALLSAGRVDEAIAELEIARRGPDVPMGLWTVLGRALLYRNLRLPEARRDWEPVENAVARARSAAPTSPDVALLRAEVLAARGELDAAHAVLTEARDAARTAHGPNEVALWCALAELAERRNRPDDADEVLGQAQATLGDCLEVRLARCRLWARRDHPAARQALAGLADGLGGFGVADRVRLRRELAETWARLGDLGRADELWRLVAQEQPHDGRSRFALVEVALRRGETERARLLLAELRQIEGSQGMLWRFGTALLRLQEARGDRARLAEAGKHLAELERQHPDWPRVPLQQARVEELSGRPDLAARHYERAVDLGEAPAAAVERLMQLLLERQEFLRAEEILSRVAARGPLPAALARLGAEVAAGNRNAPLARARARQVVRLPSNDYRDYLWLARIDQAVGESADAEQWLRTAVKLAEHAPDAWLGLVAHLGRAGQADAAGVAVAEAAGKLPADTRALTLARCHDALHQLTQAEAEYQRALAERPNDFVVLARAADFYARRDLPQRAEPLWRRLLSPAVAAPAGNAAAARRRLAALCAARGGEAGRKEALALLTSDDGADERVRLYVTGQDPAQRGRAIEQFHASAARRPPDATERLLLAELCLAAGRAGEARTALQPLVTGPAVQPQHLARYVVALIRIGDLDEAAGYLARLRQAEPHEPRTETLVGELDRARAAAKKAQ